MTQGSAVFSPCGTYRYSLRRSLGGGSGACVFLMLNPSTADADRNDPTISRCIGYAESWGFGTLEVVNLFALRATRPRDLLSADKPVGPENDAAILSAAGRADLIVAGWGAHGRHQGRNAHVRRLLGKHGHVLHALSLTRGGEPTHPLYLRADVEPFPLDMPILWPG